MLKAIIVDDEKNSRELLNTLLIQYTSDVVVLGKASSVQSGIDLINVNKPDIIFLDIEMPGGDGFDLLDAFKNANFLTCFVSGYDKYAIKAIKQGAFDYILKPVKISELQKCVLKAKVLVERNRNDKKQQIYLNESENYWVITLDDIRFIEASDNYSTLFLEDNKQIISSKSLTYFESVLPDNIFNRIHKSHIINMSKIASIQDGRSPVVLMTCGKKLPVASRRKKEFLDQFSTFQK